MIDWGLAGQLAEEFLFVHVVLERFAAVDKDNWNFVGVESADLGVGVNIDLAPGEAASLMQLDDAFLDDLAEVASFARIHNDLARLRHRES